MEFIEYKTFSPASQIAQSKYNNEELELLIDYNIGRSDKIEPAHDKTNRMTYAASEDLDQPGHLPSLI